MSVKSQLKIDLTKGLSIWGSKQRSCTFVNVPILLHTGIILYNFYKSLSKKKAGKSSLVGKMTSWYKFSPTLQQLLLF